MLRPMRIAWGVLAATFVLAAGTPAMAATPRPGTFFGGSAVTVDFEVDRRPSVTFVSGAIAVLASGECSAQQAHNVGSTSLRGSRFEIRQRLLGGLVDRRLTGRFTSRRRAKGSYREIDKTFGRDCDSGVVRWSAKLVNRRTIEDGDWSGTIDGRPLSFLVQEDGRLIDDVEGMAPPCRPEDPAHRFAGPAESTLIRPDGRFRVALSPIGDSYFAGRFTGRRSAAGSAQVFYTPTCGSGLLGWTASG